MGSVDGYVSQVRDALLGHDSIVFAVLFGSAVQDRLREDSDLDVAVYFDSGGALDVEVERESDAEVDVQLAVERRTDRNVDLLVLNRAPATVCSAAVLTGQTILVRDPSLYSRYVLAVSSVAIDFLQTEREMRENRARSHSLSEIDRERLRRILDFITEELEDRPKFRPVDLARYRNDRDLRRNLDRWVETLANAAIDIGKIVLASERRSVPRTYAQILSDLETVPVFASLSSSLAPIAPLRNLLAHEYLDLRFRRVRRFVEIDVDAVNRLARTARGWSELGDEGSKERADAGSAGPPTPG
jgi:uncharacterized protein YutE (UPF0331/DUF86 family)/predicted nucleotidyltransferase